MPSVAQSLPHALHTDARNARLGARLLVVLIVGYAALYAGLCWLRFTSFHAQIDLSYYLRLVWGLGHAHFDLPLVQASHILGLHLEPVLLPLAILSRLGVPLVPLLLCTQALAVALLSWPAYRLGCRHLGPSLGSLWGRVLPVQVGGLLSALIALLYPTVSVATLHDFHPVTLALAPLLGVVEALDDNAPRRAFWLGLLALSCREDIALQLACLLLATALRPPAARPFSRRLAVGLAVALVAYCGLYLLLVQPRFVPAHGSYHLHFDRIAQALGTPIASSRDLVLAALRHPLRTLLFFADGERLTYPLLLLWPVAGLALFSPWPLLGALPILGINFLSGFPRVLRLESHYTTAIVPFVLAAALLGAGRLLSWLSRRQAPAPLRLAVLAVLPLAALSAHVFHGGSPLAIASERFAWSQFRDGAEAPRLRAELAHVPPQASVAAPPGALAHLAQRARAISPPEYDDGRPVEVVISAK